MKRPRRAAAHGSAANAQDLIVLPDLDRFAIRVIDLHAHGVSVPHLDVDVTREIRDVELHAFRHVDGLIRRREHHHRHDNRCNHEGL